MSGAGTYRKSSDSNIAIITASQLIGSAALARIVYVPLTERFDQYRIVKSGPKGIPTNIGAELLQF